MNNAIIGALWLVGAVIYVSFELFGEGDIENIIGAWACVIVSSVYITSAE
jgi:hypothetical protein